MKKINIILTLLILLSSTLSFNSCRDNMIGLNTDDEQLTSTDPRYVFTDATANWNNNSRAHLMGKYSGVMQLMQYVVNNGGPSEGIYALTSKATNPAPYLPYYGDFYGNHGTKLYHLIHRVISPRIDKDLYRKISAISQVLLTYEGFLLLDTYGAAPYSQALQGLDGINTPKYDYIEDLYKGFDATLKEQVNILTSNLPNQKTLGNNDFFYRGDEKKWAKFANTLRIKIAQRFEKVDKAHYEAVIADALGNTAGIISTNDESCIYFHSLRYNNDTWDTAVLTSQYAASNAFVSFLVDNNDPRTPILLRRNGFGPGNNNSTNNNTADTLAKYVPNYATLYPNYVKRYVGMPASPDMNGKDAARNYINFSVPVPGKDPKSFAVRAISQVQSRFYVKNGGNAETASGAENIDYPRTDNNDLMKLFSPQITYPEVCFMMAEIAEKADADKGGKSAQQWYNEGIKASMKIYQQWGERMKVLAASEPTASDYSPINDAKITAYLAQPQVQYAGTKEHKLQLIVSQAWINFFMRPEEAWATWKRTGYPVFKEYVTPNPTDGTAFLDAVKSGGNELLIPRRSILPTPNQANISNFQEAITKLTSRPEYMQPNQSQGRIWWDKP